MSLCGNGLTTRTRLKEIKSIHLAVDQSTVMHMVIYIFDSVEKIVGKGWNACYQNFSFPMSVHLNNTLLFHVIRT